MFEWEKLNVDIRRFLKVLRIGLDLNYSYLTTWDTRKEGIWFAMKTGKPH